jgi:hypothetical protein
MAFTRFHDDPCRITKQLQQMTDQGRWTLDVPGNGDKPCFALDPQIIPQKWGANLMTNSIDIQSYLLGIDKGLNRDCLEPKIYQRLDVCTSKITYPYCDTFLTTEQSRVIMPAWTARDLPQNHSYILLENPQSHTEMPFTNYVSSRILEKDYFQRKYDCIPENEQNYVLPVKSLHQQGNSKICSSSDSCKKI